MLIPSELLAEKNYSGTRLIEITDPKVLELKAKLKAFQEEINPYLKESEKYTPEMDVVYEKIHKLNAEIEPIKNKVKALHDEIAPIRKLYDDCFIPIRPIEQRAVLVKNKMEPLINKIIAKELGEFEKPTQVIEKDGKVFVEIADELEEKVKAVRAIKMKNNASGK